LPDIDREASIIVYRVVQEALTNVIKHSAASHVVVTVTCTPGQDQLFFKIEDDGKGFETNGARTRQTYGLMGMRERVAAGGGQLRIASSPQGTIITVCLPTRSPPEPTLDDTGPITLSPPDQPTLF
jgi:signal transduction histidine kinase